MYSCLSIKSNQIKPVNRDDIVVDMFTKPGLC